MLRSYGAPAEECPFFRGAKRQEHWSFPDASAAIGTDEQRLAVYRQPRDAISARMVTWLPANGGVEPGAREDGG